MSPTWIGILIILAACFFMAAHFLLRKTGLPGGKLIYSDTHMWGQPLEKPLFDGSLAITGKPDYLIRRGEEIIPVEVKSSRAPSAPYDAHIYQVAIYCLLVEKVYQQTPKVGLIHYPGKTFEIEFTPELRNTVLNLISEMHQKENRRSLPRNHEEKWKCDRCGYKDVCDQRILE